MAETRHPMSTITKNISFHTGMTIIEDFIICLQNNICKKLNYS